ncbi:MAG: type 1 glutamine amidotransferase-like domain-containing protein [bacterium]|nr:type 1 glutamine amidotransferase-like domain-containing protein [bacterium]
MRTIKPIFLFADSQVLFWNSGKGLFIDRLKQTIESDENRPEGEIKAAYIGASNGNKPEYFDIFVAAMNQIGITNCRHILSKPTVDDYSYLRTSDLVLLAGGSTATGWNSIKRTDLREKIVECYHNGAVLVGISAGAIQLGLRGWKKTKRIPKDLFETFQIVPAVVDVHDESDWEFLRTMVHYLGNTNRGFGIPAGGGAVYHPDWSFEAVRHHLVEFSYLDEEFKRSLIFPKQEGMPEEVLDPDDPRGKVIKPDEVMSSGIINIDPEIIEN